MAYSPELRAGFPSMCRQLPSVFISSFSFCPVPLSGNKAAFSFQSCPRIVGSGVRIQWSCRCRRPLWLHQYFLLCLSLSFLPPSLLQGSRLLFARLGFLQSSVLSAFLSAQSSVSSFVMMRSLVCPIVPPPPSSFPLSCLQHNYCVYPVSDCTLSSCFTTLPTASRVSSHENCRALDLPDFEVFRVNSGHLISYSDILSKP